jgi:hypothetical protein
VTGFADLSRARLATLVPELLLCGHLIDRAGLGHVLLAHGADGMRDVAIAEWLGASPNYTRRTRAALGIDGDDVTSIFKALQIDIGAPPQFMDFRYTVHDRDHGEFHLDHCGALMDVEPMGESFVRSMCHDIEDPTFDGTAIATNPRAQMRPIHRPPRTPADRHPHCAWTVTIDESHPAVPVPPAAETIARTAAATFAGVSTIDPAEPGASDYRGPLQADVDFAAFSHSALVRLAEEVSLQGQLLTLSFQLALSERGPREQVADIGRKQFTGIAGMAADRIAAALGLHGADAAASLLAVHPCFSPHGYTGLHLDGEQIAFDRSAPAVADGGWLAMLDGAHLAPIDAALHVLDPRLRAEVITDTRGELVLRPVLDEQPRDEAPEVQITRVSTGAAFTFTDRGHRPALPVLETR